MSELEQVAPQRYRIGYILQPKKLLNFLGTSLIDYTKQRGIDLIPIDPTKPLIQQGPFHCIIHKLHPQDWNKLNLDQYLATYPHGLIIDPPHLVERLHNRSSMLDAVTNLKIPLQNGTVGVPNQVVVKTNDEIEEELDSTLRFPVIAKPLFADGTANSHELRLVFDSEGLATLNAPIVLQEFVNHGGVVFKVYVAGEHVTCVKRRSLPDISEEKAKTLKGTLPFSQISNLTVQERSNDVEIEKTEMPPQGLVTDLARALREAMGLNLFNVDVIRDAKDCKRYLVIDVNYFPGYAKLPSYESFITSFLLDSVRNKTT
ncbi:inositol-tetrakisphosphate 1-kinase 2-like [Gastrolobium bilobum]|uniref:inositol-tetrakisphosphate 1-kinase 2-like n=1 Tax=Gastrolobium bilobum TaxID=150636 RepID=UPI002AB2AF6B|nr:inositol-tetrakisphosphate 1-kinase 2-like [Gastrolobium bilobum]